MAATAVPNGSSNELARIAADAARAEHAADTDGAFTAYQRLFWAALGEKEMGAAADALRGQSRVCQHRKRFEEAEEFAQLSLEISRCAGQAKTFARALNTLAVVRFLQRDWAGAADFYAEALNYATDCGDDALVGWTCQNLGVIANLRGDFRQARALYLESVAASVRSADPTTAIAAYNSLGMICSDLREWTEALLYFDRGLELTKQLGDPILEAKMLANRAEPLVLLGEIPEALRTLARAESLALRHDDRQTLADVNRFRAMISRETNRYEEAEEYIARAAELAATEDLALEKTETMEEMARLRWRQGRIGAARATAREAIREYERLGAEQNAAVVRRLLDEWATPVG